MKLNKAIDRVPKLALMGVILCGLMIAVLSLLPGSDLPPQNLNDKLNHFIAYGALALFATLARGRMALLLVVGLVISYGLALELAQGLMPYGRMASWLDALANTGGAFIGTVGGLITEHLIKRIRPDI